jgi:hypothetical protein
MVRDARRYRQSGSDRLEKQPTDLRRKTCYFGDRTLETGHLLEFFRIASPLHRDL